MCNYLQFGIWKILVPWANNCAQPSTKCSQVWCYYWWVYACWSFYCYLIFQIMPMWQMLCCLSKSNTWSISAWCSSLFHLVGCYIFLIITPCFSVMFKCLAFQVFWGSWLKCFCRISALQIWNKLFSQKYYLRYDSFN